MFDQDLADARERSPERGAEDLSVVGSGRTARVHDVREQDGHDLPFLRHEPQSRSGC